MPSISQFFGIVIRMYYNDHTLPHFHAEYGPDEAIYEIATLEVLRGHLPRRAHALVVEWSSSLATPPDRSSLPRRAHALVVEWATLYRRELYDNWERARQAVPLRKVAPLD